MKRHNALGCMQREQSQRAHAAAEVIAARHEAAALQAKLLQQLEAEHPVVDSNSMVSSLKLKRGELLEEVCKMQASMTHAMQHSM